MADQITKLTVFIASPGDVPKSERDIVRQVCGSLNRTPYLRKNSIFLEPCGYETHVYPGVLSEHPQVDLTRLAEESDILVAIFHRKLGGAGQHAQSGTVEEIEAALSCWEKTGTKPKVLVYFRAVHEDLPGDDILEVNEFERKLHSRGNGKGKVRTEKYSDALHLNDRLVEALSFHVEEFISQLMPLDSRRSFADLIGQVPQPLLDWPYTIKEKWMDRSELVGILNEIQSLIKDGGESESRSTTLLLGSPGTGKSALLSNLGRKFREEGIPVLSIKADMVPAHIKTSNEMAEELGLPMDAADCLRRMRMVGPVVLIVDQLDAVSEIADRRSDRLNLLLNLIKTASAMDGVHVVASCRTFEYRHDVRLATIDAKIVTLQPPPWDEIGKILQGEGIAVSNLSPEIRELLEVPLHLKLLIEVFTNSDKDLASFHTIQNLYEELWRQKILSGENAAHRATLIYKIAKWMSDEEDLWAPSAVADDFPQILEGLESEAIVMREGMRIGFRHQTFFDFVLARQFATGEDKLSEYVIQRQDGLFVRPILLATLDYLRATSTHRYHRELTELWRTSNLRKHLVALLDEKLASLRDPDEVEQSFVLPILGNQNTDSTRINRLLVSMAGSSGWFELIQPAILPRYLSLPLKDAWPCSTVLIRAWPFAHDRVLDLIENYLLPDPEKDYMALSICAYIDTWDDGAVSLVCRIASRTWNSQISYLAESVSQITPEFAPKIVRADMERRFEVALRADAETSDLPPLPENASEDEKVECWLSERNTSLRKLFELGTEWYGLSNIAESAPLSFLTEMWPWFASALSRLVYEPDSIIVEYQGDSILTPSLGEEDDNYRERQPIDAICRAVIALAKEDQDAFLEFFKANAESPFLLVHRLLSWGLVNIAEARPDVVIGYLAADPRRFTIGDFQDSHKESRMLINKVVPHLDEPNRKKLENSILSWNYYSTANESWSAEDKKYRLERGRQHRLRLLRSFPEEYLSSKGRKILHEEARAFPDTPDWDSRIQGMSKVVSRMTCDQMTLAKDEHLLSLFDELNDSTEWDHPRRDLVGGVIQASREFEKLAEREPERILALVRRFQPGRQEIVTGHAVAGLSKSSLDSEILFFLIQALDGLGFVSDSFRTSIAEALRIRADREHGLPDEVLSVLERWLPDHPNPSPGHVQTSEDQDGSGSILWGHGRMFAFGGGRSRIAETMAKGLLLRQPPDIERWAGTVSRILNFEWHPDVWRIVLFEMPPLFNNDKSKATTLFDQVFCRCPQVRDSWEGAYVVSRILRAVTDIEVARNWLISIRDSSWPLGKQAFGELLMLWRCYYKDDTWGNQQIEHSLKDNSAIGVRCGLAFSASNLWRWAACQDIFTNVLTRLSASTDERTQRAIAEVFRYGEPLPLNLSMESVIDAVLPHDAVLIKSAESLIGGIESHTTAKPELVYRVCKRVLDVCAIEIGNVSTSLSMLAEPLVRISMTLHRMELYRTHGLELFELLIESDIREARQALDLLDRRPTMTNALPARRPRRRRRGN